MKSLYMITAFLFISLLARAQEEKGIRFEKGKNWASILEKASKENKYIFLDAYTSWCGPCKMMAKEIFPQESVGRFFNENFINVAVQLDVTKKDNPEIKRWYKDASELQKTYKISSYPTYLFLDPQGKIVHGIYSAIPDANEFIRLAKEAIDPQKQFLTLKLKYLDGSREPEFLYKLLVSAIGNRDSELTHAAATSYLDTRPDLLSDRNLQLLPAITKKSSDPGFAILRHQPSKADQVLGKGFSAEIVRTIIFDEMALPVLRMGGEKIDHGMMFEYKGELAKNVDWGQLARKLDVRYPEFSKAVLMTSKLTYLDWSENWRLLNKTIAASLTADKNAIANVELNRLANKVFLEVNDQEILEETISWAKLNLANLEVKNDKLNFMVTYARLLNKAGQKDEAIRQLKSTIELTDGKAQYFIEILEKMENANKGIIK